MNGKKISLLTVLLLTVLLLTACSGPDSYEIRNTAGKKITIPADNLSKEQKSVLSDVSDGKISLMDLVRGGAFSEKELSDLEIDPASHPRMEEAPKDTPPQPEGFVMDFSHITLEDLNTDGLDEKQLEAVKAVLDGTRDFRTLEQEGVLSREALQATGLLNGFAAGQQGRTAGGLQPDLSSVKLEDLNTEGLTEEQIALVKAVLSGEKDIRELMNGGLGREQIQQLGLMPQRQGGGGFGTQN